MYCSLLVTNSAVNILLLCTYFTFTDSDKWSVLMKTETGQVEEYTVSYQNLLPSTQYEFRLIAYNTYGISYPAVANEKVKNYKL